MALTSQGLPWLLGGLRLARNSRLWQAWADLSLRTKLLLFALALIILPGGGFALIAFSGARSAIEREVGIQLTQIAEQGADAVGVALERARGNARSWAAQDLMRDLVIGDLDKRLSRFLATIKASNPAYLEVVCVDPQGRIVAASSGEWLGQDAGGWATASAVRNGAESVLGPSRSPYFERAVLEIGVPIENPDPPGGRIGGLILVYDWAGIAALLDRISFKLVNLGKRVEGFVVDREGRVIGGAFFDRPEALRSAPPAERWEAAATVGYGKRRVSMPDGRSVELLIGAATVADSLLGWSVLFVEPTSEALAPVRKVRDRWILMITCILLIGLAAAALLARQVMRPLDEVTRATSQVASHLDLNLPLLPVRSRNEIGQLAESFNKMTVELKRSQEDALTAAKFAFAGELAAMVAHEVRTPLTVMRSSTQMLADPSTAGSADNAELVETIVAEVDRIGRVVNGLIELARPLEKRSEPTPLRDVLSRAADFVAAQADKQQIRVEREFEALATAFCDREQIYQVVLNLLVNALQALPREGRIWLRTLPADPGMVGFEVADDGPGVPREMLDKIFRPFVTGREGGTGLGLAFVDRVVKAHRGSVSMESELGQGTVFRVRLPVAG